MSEEVKLDKSLRTIVEASKSLRFRADKLRRDAEVLLAQASALLAQASVLKTAHHELESAIDKARHPAEKGE